MERGYRQIINYIVHGTLDQHKNKNIEIEGRVRENIKSSVEK